MDPITFLAMTNAALAFLRNAIPQIRDMANRGEITKEQQAEVLAEYKALRDQTGGQFEGPEWEQSNRT